MLGQLKAIAALGQRLGASAWRKFGTDNCSQIAAGLSYYTLFAFVPLCVLTLSVSNLFGADDTEERIIERIASYIGADETDVSIRLDDAARRDLEATAGPNTVAEIERQLEIINDPDDGVEQRAKLAPAVNDGKAVTIAGHRLEADQLKLRVEGFFSDAIRSYGDSRGPFPAISIVLAALAGSVVFSSYSRSLNHIWKVQTLRPLVQQKLVDLAALVVTGLLLLASVVASGIIGALRNSVKGAIGDQWVVQGDSAWAALLFGVPLLISFLFCASAYMFLPRSKNRFRDIWPGAVVAAVGFEGFKFGFALYISFFNNYDDAYGAFGGVLLLLLFAYLSSYLFLLGAEIAYAYPRLRDGAYDQPPPSRAAAAPARRGPLRTLLAAFTGLFVSRKED